MGLGDDEWWRCAVTDDGDGGYSTHLTLATWRACNTGRFVCCALAWALAVTVSHRARVVAERVARAEQRARAGRERARARARRLASADVDDLRTRAELDALLDAQKDALNRTQRVVDDWNARDAGAARAAPLPLAPLDQDPPAEPM